MGVKVWDKQRSFRRFLIPAATGWSGNHAQDLVSKIQNLENTFGRTQSLVLLPPAPSSSAGTFFKRLHKTGWSTIKTKQPRVNTKVM